MLTVRLHTPSRYFGRLDVKSPELQRPPNLLNVSPCAWAKPGRFGSFFELCFLALGGRCLRMLCYQDLGTHTNTQNLPHFRAFSASIQEHSLPKCLFFMANAKLPNRPGFALLLFPPWRACEVVVRTQPPPPKRGISPILARYPMIDTFISATDLHPSYG